MGKLRGMKIVSGGQTGVDRAALDWAIRAGFEHGGWCPEGRRAENGAIPAHYSLKEVPGRGYLERTRRNVKDSDATVIFSRSAELRGETLKTAEFCVEIRKPFLRLSAEVFTAFEAALLLRSFMIRRKIGVLNVAGPRESQEPAAAIYAAKVLELAFGDWKAPAKRGIRR
jgi:hypothetical protein